MDGRWVLVDSGSQFGTYVNGRTEHTSIRVTGPGRLIQCGPPARSGSSLHGRRPTWWRRRSRAGRPRPSAVPPRCPAARAPGPAVPAPDGPPPASGRAPTETASPRRSAARRGRRGGRPGSHRTRPAAGRRGARAPVPPPGADHHRPAARLHRGPQRPVCSRMHGTSAPRRAAGPTRNQSKRAPSSTGAGSPPSSSTNASSCGSGTRSPAPSSRWCRSCRRSRRRAGSPVGAATGGCWSRGRRRGRPGPDRRRDHRPGRCCSPAMTTTAGRGGDRSTARPTPADTMDVLTDAELDVGQGGDGADHRRDHRRRRGAGVLRRVPGRSSAPTG